MVTSTKSSSQAKQVSNNDPIQAKNGGGGIRTRVGGVTPETVFKTAAFNRSATPPGTGVRSRLVDRGERVTRQCARQGQSDPLPPLPSIIADILGTST